MPTRWIDLMLRIDAVLDQVDETLADYDRTAFYQRVIRTLVQRRHNRKPRHYQHPQPGPRHPAIRDVTGAPDQDLD